MSSRSCAARALALCLALVLGPGAGRVQALSVTGAFVRDVSGNPRSSFSTTELIVLQLTVTNETTSNEYIKFNFRILNEAGQQVFKHWGNAVKARQGNITSQVSGIPVSQFATTAGQYTFEARATLSGVPSTKTADFAVSSPDVTLSYPPNGATEVPSPLFFQWFSAGASSYKLVMWSSAGGSSEYSPMYSKTDIPGTALTHTYPDPAPEGATLSQDYTYYWKVIAQDAGGNPTAESAVGQFQVAQPSSMSKDMAVTAIDVQSRTGSTLVFYVSVQNQGGITLANVPLHVNLCGLPLSGTPKTIASLGQGAAWDGTFTGELPADQDNCMASANVEISDDNFQNNFKYIRVEQEGVEEAEDDGFIDTTRSRAEMIEEICRLLMESVGEAGSGCIYDMSSFDSWTDEEIQHFLDQYRQGMVDVQYGVLPDVPVYIPPSVSGLVTGTPVELPPEDSHIGREWRGLSIPFTDRTTKVVLRRWKDFKRFWRRVSDKKIPDVNFDEVMVIGVVAGGKDRAFRIEIEEVHKTIKGLVVQYEMRVRERAAPLASEKESEQASVPFHLKAILKSGMAVNFEERKRRAK